jgi:ubiquinone/menaquinone biosynthesis C-methylase UbiE
MFEVAKWTILVIAVFVFCFFVLLRVVRHFLHFPVPSIATRLIDNPIRRRLIQKPGTVADRMELQSGMTVVEIGPGSGTYTIAVAERILPNGKVFAIDIQEQVIRSLEERLKRDKVTNVFPRIDNAHNFSFPDESVDRVFAVASLPEIPDPILVLCECNRILRPQGLVSLCELMMDPDYPRRKTEKKWAQEAGLKLENEFGNFVSYQLNFRKS